MKKKYPKNTFFITDPVYCQDFLVVLTSTHAKYTKIVKKLINLDVAKDDGMSGCFQALSSKKKGDLGIIWISNKSHSLIHEIFHATAWVLLNRDIKLDSEASEECWAYYISYLYREIRARLT